MGLEKIIKYRNIWLGAAMLYILWFHSGFLPALKALEYLKGVGYGGVDICLFASGIGCYYSLEKDSDILRFLQRRIRRLAPVYFVFIIPWLLWRLAAAELPLPAVLGNLLGLQTLVSWDYHFNWYLSGLVIYYLCLPYLRCLTNACSKWWQDLLAVCFLLAVSVPFWISEGDGVIILSRLPVLYAGVVFGKMAKQGYVLQRKDYWIQALLAVAGAVCLAAFVWHLPDYLGYCGLYWYPFVLIVPAACIFLSLLAQWLEKRRFLRWIYRVLELTGIYSFEVYLVHILLYEQLLPGVIFRFDRKYWNLLWLLSVSLVAAGSFLLNRTVLLLKKLWQRKGKKAKA